MVHKSLKIMTFNVRSLIDKSRQIDIFKTLSKNNIDIGFIQETHLRQNRKIFINGYNFINDNANTTAFQAILVFLAYLSKWTW